MKDLKKISRENLKSINGGIATPPMLFCQAPNKQVKCVNPDNGSVSWQCTPYGDSRLCLRTFEV